MERRHWECRPQAVGVQPCGARPCPSATCRGHLICAPCSLLSIKVGSAFPFPKAESALFSPPCFVCRGPGRLVQQLPPPPPQSAQRAALPVTSASLGSGVLSLGKVGSGGTRPVPRCWPPALVQPVRWFYGNDSDTFVCENWYLIRSGNSSCCKTSCVYHVTMC